MDRIFCSEQIVVPPELPTILKTFSKEVIKNQPKDLVRFCANYWAKLANISLGREAFPQYEPDISPQQLITLNNELKAMDVSNSTYLTQHQILRACESAQIPVATAESVLQVGNFSDPEQINCTEFVVLSLGLATTSLLSTIELVFTVFATDNSSTLKPSLCLELLSYLGRRDETLDFEKMKKISALLDNKEKVSFEEIKPFIV
eukprot:TRINITY_DN2857_c0_g1_i2.p1 TRINITY_DN2857_c0_g1~~TRINITY_DN2857_c0_g1_i2.p1  ORF type:complete len:204 (+),score=57.88 TRINITY_DN2857_c0_g1_i2:37-648(+)